MHTAQETFDHIVACLREQGKRSVDWIGGCAYRGNGGLKCAAGWCIDDSEYRDHLENHVASETGVRQAIERSGWDFRVAEDMQGIHDGWLVDSWESGFAEVARRHELTYREPAAT